MDNAKSKQHEDNTLFGVEITPAAIGLACFIMIMFYLGFEMGRALY